MPSLSSSSPPPLPLILVIGPTGTGKSDLAIELALHHNGEIINADAMQMYRGLPVLTNQLPPHERRGVPHHLLGHIDVGEPPWALPDFCRAAERLVGEIRARGRLPVVVGGTTYYVRGLLADDARIRGGGRREEGEGEGEGDDLLGEVTAEGGGKAGWKEDRELDLSELDSLSTEDLFSRLQAVDPAMAAKWQPADRRKIHRSLEIFLRTGRRASDIYAEQRARKARHRGTDAAALSRLGQPLLFWVHAEPEVLKARLDRRVDKMLDVGLLDEVAAMAEIKRRKETPDGRAVSTDVGIWQSIGVTQLLPYVDALRKQRDNCPDALDARALEKLKQNGVEEMKVATRQYSRYQTRFIKSKLVPQLLDHIPPSPAQSSETQEQEQEQEQLPPHHPHLFVLDSTSPPSWPTAVSAPALSIAASFLRGDPLPAPPTLSPLACAVLADCAHVTAALTATVHCRRTCDVCGVTCLTEAQWAVHLASRGHRNVQRRKTRRALVAVGGGRGPKG